VNEALTCLHLPVQMTIACFAVVVVVQVSSQQLGDRRYRFLAAGAVCDVAVGRAKAMLSHKGQRGLPSSRECWEMTGRKGLRNHVGLGCMRKPLWLVRWRFFIGFLPLRLLSLEDREDGMAKG
jgi:hypothetical protein